MKKVVLTLALASFVLAGNAQILKNDFLKDYKEGDALEKSTYEDKSASIAQDTWCGAFSSTPNPNPGPKVGGELSYKGYPEAGLSIALGGLDGAKASRQSVYGLTDGRKYGKGVMYISFLANLSKLGKGTVEIGAAAGYIGGASRAAAYIGSDGAGSIRFSAGLLKKRAEVSMSSELDKTHLVVLKMDYDNQTVSLFVDPELGGEEPEASCVVEGDEGNALKHAIRGITFRNRGGFEGNVGSFRFVKTWADLTAQPAAL